MRKQNVLLQDFLSLLVPVAQSLAVTRALLSIKPVSHTQLNNLSLTGGGGSFCVCLAPALALEDISAFVHALSEWCLLDSFCVVICFVVPFLN